VGTVLSLPRFDTEAAKTSARNARHAAPAFTGAAASNAKPVPDSNDYGSFEYLPVAFTKKQIDALPSQNDVGNTTYTYGGASGWFIGGSREGLIEAITEKNSEMLKYALAEYREDPDAPWEKGAPPELYYYVDKGGWIRWLPSGAVECYMLVRVAQ